MLDHILLDMIAAIRSVFEDALLERQAIEERFQVDVFLGDVSWETSYSLPGEGSPPRVRADISLDWPTWSQSAYRSWSIGESPDEFPEFVIEIALRIQRMSKVINPTIVIAALDPVTPGIGTDLLERSSPTIEQVFDDEETTSGSDEEIKYSEPSRCAIEVSYEGTCRLDEAALTDPETLEKRFAPLGRWIASTLVRLGDLNLPFLPPDDPSLGVD